MLIISLQDLWVIGWEVAAANLIHCWPLSANMEIGMQSGTEARSYVFYFWSFLAVQKSSIGDLKE